MTYLVLTDSMLAPAKGEVDVAAVGKYSVFADVAEEVSEGVDAGEKLESKLAKAKSSTSS